MPDNFEFAARVQDISKGKSEVIEIMGSEILICHTREGFFAVDNLCTHADARLSEGKVKGHRVLCPLHGAAFDVRDGSALSRPATLPLCSYPLRIEGDDILLDTTGRET